MTRPDVVVVGGGAAGLIAAWRAGALGARVLLLEKTSRLGTKILISGGGKCNITHAGPTEDLVHAFRPAEGRFLRPALYRYGADDILEIVHGHGIETYVREDGRVFPVEKAARDVVEALASAVASAGVTIAFGASVQRIETADSRVSGVEIRHASTPARTVIAKQPGFSASASRLLADVLSEPGTGAETPLPAHLSCGTLVVAAGGSSYPASGTTGDGWAWMRALGHTIEPVRAALAPIYLVEPKPDLSGLAFRGCRLRARADGKSFVDWRGDLLLTHHGVSGPCALGVSREVAERHPTHKVTLEVDLIPDVTFEELAADLARRNADAPRRLVASYVADVVPARAADWVLDAAGVDPTLPFVRLDRRSRNALSSTLKALPIGIVKAIPLEKGEVVAGGVSLDEVDPRTMASRKIEGLFLCGEVLDIAGPIGGYNLQAAFSTGFVAGESAASYQRVSTV